MIVKNNNSLLLKENMVQRNKSDQYESKDKGTITTNLPPFKPSQLIGPTEGTINMYYSYYTWSLDPDNDQIQYGIDFNYDNNINEEHWTEYYPSGQSVTIELLFQNPGIYPLRVKAKDIHGAESVFSEILYVEITYEGRIIHVPNDYKTIQIAVNNAFYKDTILVEHGCYNENIIIDKEQNPIKSINIIGENKKTTVIDAGGSDAVIRIYSDYINISGFTIRNGGPMGGSYIGSGVHLAADHCTISNNIISVNDKIGLLISGDNNIIKDNIISENVKWGVHASNTEFNKIYHNNFINNTDYNAWDIQSDNIWYDEYALEGNYWDDYTGLDANNDGIGDTAYGIYPYPEENKDEYPFIKADGWIPSPPLLPPDLTCVGSLTWSDVPPGNTVYGNFVIMNNGKPGSMLNWEIVEWPTWGDWTFDPQSGENLTPEDKEISVFVSIDIPNVKNTEFNEIIKVINRNDSNDSCEIPVSLSISRKKAFDTFLNRFLGYNNSNLFSILRQLLKKS